MFDLKAFLAQPSIEQFNKLLKDDLLELADHLGIVLHRPTLKDEVKTLVLQKLIDLDLLSVPKPSPEKEEDLPDQTPLLLPEGGVVEVVEENIVSEQDGDEEEHVAPGSPPLSSVSGVSGASQKAKLKVRLTRLRVEAEERAQKAEYEHKLALRRLELDVEREVKLKQLELEILKVKQAPSQSKSTSSFDVAKNVALVPPFRESEVDSYFGAFERIAQSLKWPEEVWPILLQCKLSGKAQEVVSSLSLDEVLKYDKIKGAILRAYELVPEAYRQKFRNHKKASGQSYVEFAREKGVLFDKWCVATKVQDFDSLRNQILIEEFKSTMPEKIVTYLNERKVTSLSQAAILADEFVLTHKQVFVSSQPTKSFLFRSAKTDQSSPQPEKTKNDSSSSKDERECYYCKRKGHVISECLTLKRKQQSSQSSSSGSSQPKPVSLIKTISQSSIEAPPLQQSDN